MSKYERLSNAQLWKLLDTVLTKGQQNRLTHDIVSCLKELTERRAEEGAEWPT